MKIDELDEWQGLTREMVDHYLNRTGWCNMPDPDIRLLKPQYAHVSLKMGLSAAVERIACIECRTLQALLREINPRWRKGFPSNAALAEHDEWLIRAPWGAEFVAHISYGGSDDGYMIMIPPDSESGDCGGIEESVWGDCFYWPCDGNANRVRWPVDAEGKML